jgi:hypothetical protein
MPPIGYVGFITHWKEQKREYDKLTPVANHFSDEMTSKMLMKAVSLVPQLDAVKTTLQVEVIQGHPMPTYDRYLTLIESVATTLDSRESKLASKSLIKTETIASYHDMYDDDPDVSPFKAEINNWESYVQAQDDVHHGIDTSVKELEVFAT